jgi:magnesium-transporting ATPase (P-type)
VESLIETGIGGQHKLRIGRPDWLNSAQKAETKQLLSQLHTKNGQRIDVELDGRPAAIAMLSERMRDTVPTTLADLQTMNLPMEVWTGDRPDRASALGFPVVRGSLTPPDKHRLISERKNDGRRPLFVGDGINDAGALASAHVGIALASGTDLANGAAAITLYHGDLRVIPWAIALARQSVTVMQRTLWRAGIYNLVGVALAALGVLHPVVAALLMVASSLLVAWSAGRTGTMPVVCSAHSAAKSRVSWRLARPVRIGAVIHVLALALQGWLWAKMLIAGPGAPVVVIGAFVAAGLALAYIWVRWVEMPHHVDMILGMLTLGNLGMLFGWWVDLRFQAFPEWRTCGCGNPINGLGMWAGMFVAANLAMWLLQRRPHSFSLLAWIGGNVGMAVGMAIGGNLVQGSAPGHFVGMTLGMLLGMALGHEFLPEFASIHKPLQAT